MLRWLILVALLCGASGEAGVVSTLIGYLSGDGGAATSANIDLPTGVVVDSSENIYIASFNDYKIRKIDSTGTITSVVGSGIGYGTAGSTDGAGTSASVNTAHLLALDSSNNVFIADTGSHKIRKLTIATGIVSTYACDGSVTVPIGANNVAATSSSCYYPYGVALDSNDNVYIADTYHNQVRKVTASTGIISAFAGTGGTSPPLGDGDAATSAKMYYPIGIALDSSGNAYISDLGYCLIRKVTASTGIITTIAGTAAAYSFGGDGGAATSAQLYLPNGVALDPTGNVYIADTYNYRIRKLTVSTGIITTIAGTGTASYSGDNGAATSATLNLPIGLYYYSSSSSIYIGDYANNVIRKISSTGIISTVAGHTRDTSQSTTAQLSSPKGVAVDASGNVYVSENSGHKVKKMVISTGLVSDIAGTGATTSSGDEAAATSAGVYSPTGIALDTSGNVYIAETLGNRIRKLTISTGLISTIVGTAGTAGTCSDSALAASTSCKVNNPIAIEVDSSGNVYYSDTLNYKVKKLATTGIVTDIAGSGSSSTDGDGSSATSAGINKPYGFVFDSAGNIIISEYGSHKVRKVTVATGSIISTIAGTGTSGYSGDGGTATSATLNAPADVAIDSYGDIYITDSSNNKIRKITVSTGIISTIAGSSTSGSYTGNNIQATSATFNTPFAIAIDSANNIYVTDASNGAVRKIEGSTSTPTHEPSSTPTIAPTKIPTMQPTIQPTRQPSATPTVIPSTVAPSKSPSYNPTRTPSNFPTVIPTSTAIPSIQPTSAAPTHIPTIVPTTQPPTKVPSCVPSMFPTFVPSSMPSQLSSVVPTDTPSIMPTMTLPTSPTTEPTVAPTTLLPTHTPTTYPTDIPTSFPTFVDGARVFFIVCHDFEGSVPSDLDISKGTSCSNAFIDSIIESMSPYPITSNEINLIAVQNTSTVSNNTRSLMSKYRDTVAITYSFDISTRIFDSAERALGAYITTLNDSILSGDFDTYLRSNSLKYLVDDFNNLVSTGAIFTTASPTSAPTSVPTSSTPTSNPTKVNILGLNGFDAEWDPRYVNTKARFYLASYILYFVGIYLMLYLLDSLGMNKQFLAKLQLSSFYSNVHKIHEHEYREIDSSIKRLAKLCKQSKELFETEKTWRMSIALKGTDPTNELDDAFRESDSYLGTGHFDKSKRGRSSRFSELHKSLGGYLRRVSTQKEKTTFTPAYFRYLHGKRTLLMADPYLYPHGFECRICCIDVVIPMGIIEDYILFVCNNHQVFSCIFGVNEHTDSRSARRLIYCTQNIISFFISAFTGSIFNYFEFGIIVSQVFDALIISPVSLAVANFIRYLYKLQIIHEDTEYRSIFHKYMIKALIVFIFLSSFVMLFLAALFTYNENKAGIILQYFTQVQLVCFFYEIILSTMLFVPTYHYNLSVRIPLVLNLSLINIGQLYLEKILKNDCNDYVCFQSSLFGGFFTVNHVVSKEYASHKGWISTESDSLPPILIEENLSTGESNVTPTIRRLSINPLLQSNPDNLYPAKARQSIEPKAAMEMSVVSKSHDHHEEEVTFDAVYATDDNCKSINNVDHISNIIDPVKVSMTNPLLNMNKPTQVEEEDTLFQLYKNEILHESTEGNEEMTFEEWKIKRRQFNPNTRKTFISSYRVFEDLEEMNQQRKDYMNRAKKVRIKNSNICSPRK